MRTCEYCGKEYKSEYRFKEHVQRHKYLIEKAKSKGPWYGSDPIQIGNCANCERFVISPPKGVNYSSISNLKKNGFTGDIDPSTGKLYCFNCMKKLGWLWGEKEEAEVS